MYFKSFLGRRKSPAGEQKNFFPHFLSSPSYLQFLLSLSVRPSQNPQILQLFVSFLLDFSFFILSPRFPPWPHGNLSAALTRIPLASASFTWSFEFLVLRVTRYLSSAQGWLLPKLIKPFLSMFIIHMGAAFCRSAGGYAVKEKKRNNPSVKYFFF